MKEASGELSMTAVAVVAIAAVGVLFTTLIWPNIKRGISVNANCSQAFNCDEPENGKRKCEYCKNDDCSKTGTVYCDDKDASSQSNGTADGGQ